MTACAFEPIDISPVFFDVTFNDDVQGGGNSGLTFVGGELYSIDQNNKDNDNLPIDHLDDEACLHGYNAAGVQFVEIPLTIVPRNAQGGTTSVNGEILYPRDPDTLVVVPLADFEGLTYISGVRGTGVFLFAIAHESTGYVYLFDMNDAIVASGNNTPYDVVNNGARIETGLVSALNCGLEGIAYDPAEDCFYVAKEGTEPGELARGIYKVPNDTTYVAPAGGPLFLADPMTLDVAGLAVSGNYLYVVSQAGASVTRYGIQPDGSLIHDLAMDAMMNTMLGTGGSQYEGIAVDAANNRFYVIGEKSDVQDDNELRRYELTASLVVHDINSDGVLDGDDIDLVSDGVANNDPIFDLNLDGNVNDDDRIWYVEEFLYTFLGDVTLDRIVNAADLNPLGQNWQDQGTHLGWADGDVVDDDLVDAKDLTEVALYWQMKKL